MGSVGKAISGTVSNIGQTITKPVVKLFTNPTKLNIGDVAVLGTAGLAAPTVDLLRHPGDTPVVAGTVLTAAGVVNALPAAAATATAASGTDSAVSATSADASAGAYSGSFSGGGGGGPGFGLTGTSNPLDLNYVGPAIPSAAIKGSVDSQGGLWGFLGRAGDSAKSLFSPILNAAGSVANALGPTIVGSSLYKALNLGNSARGDPGIGGGITIGTTNTPGLGGTLGQGAGYAPFGSAGSTLGYPASADATGALGPNALGGGNLWLYVSLGALIFVWLYLFQKKRHA